ncbi:MAG TPA: dolichyl-phosphate beta-glucosyltransferase [Nitrolancea sp.]|nr:dolichyl-phosphate beta-glucosyltransferase [Nitrolancea sp.]
MFAGQTTEEMTRPGPEPDISLIIPCYNEATRLPGTLATALAYLAQRPYRWELLIADDGSSDATPDIAAEAARQPGVRHLRLAHRGKAAAVRAGVEAAQGRFIIFTDADLSTPIEYIDQVQPLLMNDFDLVIGTREGEGARRVDEPFYRHLMGRLFNYLVQGLLVRGVRDTQCGFKAFRAEVARDLFARSRLYRGANEVHGPLVTGFDVELLFLAHKLGYRLSQLPVTWHHVEGSKVRPGLDSLLMIRDILRVRFNDLRGRYDLAAQPHYARRGAGIAEK